MPTREERLAAERARDLMPVETSVDQYQAMHPDRPLGPFRSFEEAERACAKAIADGRELTDAERERIEYRDGDDIAGSEF